MSSLKVCCDEPGCGWCQAITAADMPGWLNKPCPKCGKGVIVTPLELAEFQRICPLVEAMEAQDALYPSKDEGVLVVMDSAPLREGKGVGILVGPPDEQ